MNECILALPSLSWRESARKGVRLWPSRLLADSVLRGFLQSNSFLQSSMSSTCCQSLTHLPSPVPPRSVLEWLPIPNTCNLWLWGLSLAAKVQRWASCDEARGVNSLALPDFYKARWASAFDSLPFPRTPGHSGMAPVQQTSLGPVQTLKRLPRGWGQFLILVTPSLKAGLSLTDLSLSICTRCFQKCCSACW